MKTILIFILLLNTSLLFSCSEGSELKQDSTKNQIKKYDSPTNTIVYINALDKNVNLNELSDWTEKDTTLYTGINYYYNSAGINDSTYEEINMSEESGRIIPKFRMGEGKFIELNSVRITGNKFYSVLTMNGISEELNGRFVKMKAPPNSESEFIYGLLINRRGEWKFFYMYV